MVVTPEMRSELLTILRTELEREEQREKENRTVYRRICRDFEQEFCRYNYVVERHLTKPDGESYTSKTEYRMHWKVRDAIGTLLRAVYKADAVAKLPAEKEAEMREFVRSVLGIMAQNFDENERNPS